MKFRAKVLLAGKTATGIRVPAEVVESLGPSRRPAVRVTINGYAYRSSVATLGGAFMVGISGEVHSRAGVSAGDLVDVAIELDPEPHEVTVPADFAAALKRDARATRFFESLSYSKKRRFVLSIEGAKTSETRHRRIASALRMLRERQA